MGERRAYIIEDEKLLRDLVRQSLADCCSPIEEYESAESFLAGHDDRPAGCIIVDINLPGINGLDLLEVIARGRAASGDIGRATATSPTPCGQAPWRVDSSRSHSRRRAARRVEKGFALLESTCRGLGACTLTRREKEVLVAFADGAPNKIVAHDLGLSVRTVELHRANLMKKLGVRSLSQALLIAKDGGYV